MNLWTNDLSLMRKLIWNIFVISVKELMRHQKFVPDRLINWGKKSAADTFDIANLPEPKGDLILPVLALTEPGGRT